MSRSVIPQLVRKDFRMMRGMILVFGLLSLSSIGVLSALFGQVPQWVLINIAFVLLLAPAMTCGIVLMMKTNVFEKEKSTQAFIMSLPVTVKDFTAAKIWVNLPVFSTFWLLVSGVAFYFSFGRGLLPMGAIPFVTMVLLGIFVAYACILATSLLSQSLPVTVLGIALFEMGTSAYLWTIVFLEPIQRHIQGSQAVWDSAAVTIVIAQVAAAVTALGATVAIQTTKRDII